MRLYVHMAQELRFSSIDFSSDDPIYPNSCFLSSSSRRVNRAMVIQHCRFDSNQNRKNIFITLRCVIPVVCVTNEREESVVNQHN